MSAVEHPLGCLPPTTSEHRDKYPLSALPPQMIPKAVPVVVGIPWLSTFDRPVEKMRGGVKEYWIGLDKDLGRIRGWHAVCLKPGKTRDYDAWYRWYDQGTEGACVGFACSRMMTLLNRLRFDARWLYHEAQKRDEWPGEDYSGTSVRAALDVLRDVGHRRWVRSHIIHDPDLAHGISANRWCRDAFEVMAALDDSFNRRRGAIVLLNSWGTGFPHFTHMPAEVLDKLLEMGGDAGIPTDR